MHKQDTGCCRFVGRKKGDLKPFIIRVTEGENLMSELLCCYNVL